MKTMGLFKFFAFSEEDKNILNFKKNQEISNKKVK